MHPYDCDRIMGIQYTQQIGMKTCLIRRVLRCLVRLSWKRHPGESAGNSEAGYAPRGFGSDRADQLEIPVACGFEGKMTGLVGSHLSRFASLTTSFASLSPAKLAYISMFVFSQLRGALLLLAGATSAVCCKRQRHTATHHSRLFHDVQVHMVSSALFLFVSRITYVGLMFAVCHFLVCCCASGATATCAGW